MSLSNQSIHVVNQNYIENKDLVSTVDFRVQSTLGKVNCVYIIYVSLTQSGKVCQPLTTKMSHLGRLSM